MFPSINFPICATPRPLQLFFLVDLLTTKTTPDSPTKTFVYFRQNPFRFFLPGSKKKTLKFSKSQILVNAAIANALLTINGRTQLQDNEIRLKTNEGKNVFVTFT